MSKREKMIAYVTGGALGLFLLDYVAIEPLLAHRGDLVARVIKADQDVQDANTTIERGKIMKRKWAEMTKAGLTTETSAAEAQALNALNDWAADSRLELTSIKPERTERVKQLNQITIRATAQGNLASVGRFLYHIQTSEIPMRVTDFQMNARKEGLDDLTLQLGVSTIAQAPPEQPKRGVTPAAAAGGAR